MWSWTQREGALVDQHGEIVAHGYAGAGPDKNRPESQGKRNQGPLPRGEYFIGAPHTTRDHGPYVLRLTPDGANEMEGRSGFLVHGDSKSAPGAASQGCIVLPKATRVAIWESGDRLLRVVVGMEDL